MADGGGGGTGRMLAGCGCLTWLGCVLLIVLWEVVSMFAASSLPTSVLQMSGLVVSGAGCCSSIGFIVGLVGIIMMLVGGRKSADDS